MSVVNNNLLLTADAGVAPSAYQISRSLRFNSADSAYLNRTPSVAGNRKTWTWAGWVKLAKTSFNNLLECVGPTTPGTRTSFIINDLDRINFFTDNTSTALITTAQVFRDYSSWYHIVLAVDTTLATASDRVKLYVNNSRVTTFTTATYPSQNLDTQINNTQLHTIARVYDPFYANMSLADIHFIDGQALTPSSFTETNATTGQLVPKAYTGTYGTNGFRLNFSDNSAATAATLGADSSGNGNNWTPNNFSVANSFLGGNNGTLVNGPTYSSANGGSIVFDGSNDYVSFTNSSNFSFGTNNFAISYWFYANSLSGNPTILDTRTDVTGTGPGFADFFSGGNKYNIYVNNATRYTSNASFAVSTWYNICVARSGSTTSVYVNGALDGTYSDTLNISANGLLVARNINNTGTSYLNGRVSNVLIYNSKALTAPEVTQNYNALVGRFGGTSSGSIVTSGLVLNLDAGNSTSYPGTGTTWTDISTRTNPGIDSLTDTPTSYGTDTGAGGEVRGNYCTWNPLISSNLAALTNGNLDATGSSDSGGNKAISTLAVNSGKWYYEITLSSISTGDPLFGICKIDAIPAVYPGQNASSYSVYTVSTNTFIQKVNNATFTNTDTTKAVQGDVIGLAFDLDSGKFWASKNGTWIDSGNPSAGTNPLFSSISGTYAANIRSAGNGSSTTLSANFGQRPFAYAAPSGFKALCDTNLPTPTIAKGSSVFDATLYTGTGAALTPTSSLAFSPDLVWIKGRSGATDHALYDTVRGATLDLVSNSTAAETTQTQGVTAFNSNGFSVGTLAKLNTSAATYAGWAWDAGSSTVTNTAGTINSQVRANASAGFSVVTYTGTQATATVGHGLGVAPSMIIAKSRTVAVTNFVVYHTSLGGTNKVALLNSANAPQTITNYWGSTAPTSTVFGVANGVFDNNNGNLVAYCFAPVTGYSSFGSYTGNGSADGSFVYLGLKPTFILIKRTDTTGNWVMLDGKRAGYNVDNDPLYANLTNAEATTDLLDITSNGFKLRSTNADCNASGSTYIYAAFAENPFQFARAR